MLAKVNECETVFVLLKWPIAVRWVTQTCTWSRLVTVHWFFNMAVILNQEFDVFTCEAEDGKRILSKIYMQTYNFMVASCPPKSLALLLNVDSGNCLSEYMDVEDD